jgi:hypothetical protein
MSVPVIIEKLENVRTNLEKKQQQQKELEFAFMVWMHDEFSLHLLLALIEKGYSGKILHFFFNLKILSFALVICGETANTKIQQPLDGLLLLEIKRLSADCGVHFISIDYKDAASLMNLRQRATEIVGKARLSLGIFMGPFSKLNQWGETARAKFSELNDVSFWTWRAEFTFLAPSVIASSLAPLFNNSPTIVFHGYGLGSVSQNSSGGMFNTRAGFSAIYSVIKSLSFDFPNGIVVGLNPGLWAPGCYEVWTMKTPETEICARFVEGIGKLKPEHSGKMIKVPNMEIIPP